MPERDIESLGVMGKGAGGSQEILPPSRRAFSDTYERSRRATAGKLLAISLRFFFVFIKMPARLPAVGPRPPAVGPGPRPWARGPSSNATCHLVKVKSNLSFG